MTPDDAWGLLGAFIVVPDVLLDIHMVLLSILRFLPQAHLPNGTRLPFPEELHLEELIWLTVTSISTVADLHAWMEIVGELTDEQRLFAFSDEVAEEGALVIADVLWMREAAKPRTQQQWNMIQQALETLASWAASFHLELLWACAMRARSVIAAEFRAPLLLRKRCLAKPPMIHVFDSSSKSASDGSISLLSNTSKHRFG